MNGAGGTGGGAGVNDAAGDTQRVSVWRIAVDGDNPEGTARAVAYLVAAHEQVAFSPRLRARVQHAIARFDRPLEAELFGDNRTLIPDSEQAALGLLRSTATDLHAAGAALDVAAEWLKNLGKGFQASQAKQAANAAHAAAKGLVSE
jgi:hypothetical protein